MTNSHITEREKQRIAERMYLDDGERSFDVNKFNQNTANAFKDSAQAMDRAELGKTTKLFGFKVDAGIAEYLSSIYNNASNIVFQMVLPQTHTTAKKLGMRAGLAEGSAALNRTAALSTFGVAVALKAGKDIGAVYSDIREARKERQEMTRRVADVLDDIKGRHSLGAFDGVKQSENEVIYAQRQRMNKIAGAAKVNSLTSLAINAGPNLMLDTKVLRGMLKGQSPTEVMHALDAKKAEENSNASQMQTLRDMFVNTTTGQVAGRMAKLNDFKLRNSLQPFSALEMILELKEQVESNPKSRGFQLPKSYQNPKGRPKELPLEEYVPMIFMQHQKDMAGFSSEHTEIRDALKQDLLVACQPIVKAVRNGDMDVLSLVRLVGEQKVVRNRGRAVADAEDVAETIARMTAKEASTHESVAEHLKDASYSVAQLKQVLNMLEGKEQVQVGALFSNDMLRAAGLSDSEIKTMRAQQEKLGKNQILAEVTLGVASESDEALKKEGLAKPEIKLLHEASKAIEQDGVEAIDQFKANHTRPQGIERVLDNWAVPQITKDKQYFGKVVAQGKLKLEAAEDAAEQPGRHTAKEHHKRASHAHQEAEIY